MDKVNQSCSNCYFMTCGKCRRYPPVNVGDCIVAHPSIFPGEWCGEWAAREAAAQIDETGWRCEHPKVAGWYWLKERSCPVYIVYVNFLSGERPGSTYGRVLAAAKNGRDLTSIWEDSLWYGPVEPPPLPKS